MIYQFITDTDLDVGMKKYFRDQISVTASSALALSEGAAFTLIKAKINNRYDLTKLFPPIKEWDGTIAFAVDDYTSKGDVIYKALQAGTNQDPVTATTYWTKSDPRDQMLVMNCVHITLFFYSKGNDQRKINQDVIDNYTTALEWLDDIKNQIENPDWPLLIDGSSEIQFGSRPPQENYRW